ncbi:MAG: TonB-dependent receptor, partial [Rhodothermales bacterium]|nr:TonB-dependent receptor [Rhodothermales bacterium]
SYMDAESIANLPVQEVSDLLQLQSGVAYDAAGRLHLRGGRSGEVAYLVDGIPVTNQYSGGSKLQIENSWIQELQVISGVFNAEYGQAQSGVINIVTKTGSPDGYSGSVSTYVGSYLTGHSDMFVGADRVRMDEYNAEFSLNGPLPVLRDGSFFTTLRYTSNDGWLYGERRVLIEDTVPIQAYIQEAQQTASDSTTLIGIPIPDSLLRGDRSLVPMNRNERLSLQARLSFRPFESLRVGYSLFLNDAERRSYSDARRYAPDGQPTIFDIGINHIVSATHTLSQKTYYKVGLSWQANEVESYLFDDPLDQRYQGSAYGANGFLFGGTANGRSIARQETMLGQVELESQVTRSNLIKTGLQARFHRVYSRSMSTISDGPVYLPPTQRVPAMNTAGNDEYETRPREISAFIQDKIEVDELIMNVGLRFDHWNPNHVVPANPEATTDPDDGIRLDTDFVDAESSSQLSPRAGLAFPISERGVLHVSYGHFFQVPRFSYIFANSEFEVELGDLETIMGNANLKPERTVAYELGLQQALTDQWKIELTVYYKDIKNLLGQEIINTLDKKVYARYVNRDYGNTRGIVLSLIKQYSDMFGMTADYTYQVARGNASDPNAVFFNNQSQPPQEPEKQVLPLDWDQRHSLNGTVILGDPRNWTLSLIGRFNTGQPYTPSNPRSALSTQLENSERKPLNLNLDVNLAKRLSFAGADVRVYAKAYNVLDRLNARSVYSSTGTPFQPFRTLGETEVLLQNPNFTLDEIDRRPDFLGAPRRVVIGIDLNF